VQKGYTALQQRKSKITLICVDYLELPSVLSFSITLARGAPFQQVDETLRCNLSSGFSFEGIDTPPARMKDYAHAFRTDAFDAIAISVGSAGIHAGRAFSARPN
jgi:hypothetical protein